MKRFRATNFLRFLETYPNLASEKKTEKTIERREEKYLPFDPPYPNPRLSNPDPRLYSFLRFHCLEF